MTVGVCASGDPCGGRCACPGAGPCGAAVGGCVEVVAGLDGGDCCMLFIELRLETEMTDTAADSASCSSMLDRTWLATGGGTAVGDLTSASFSLSGSEGSGAASLAVLSAVFPVRSTFLSLLEGKYESLAEESTALSASRPSRPAPT